MIDYRTHVAMLSVHQAALAAAALADPTLAARRDQLLKDVQDNPGTAVLGSLVGHLFRHASSDGEEIELLTQAAALWAEGVDLYTTISQIREDVEAALSDPANPTSAAKFCAATTRLRGLQTQVMDKHLEIGTLGEKLSVMSHIPEHPRQQDKPLTEWGWGDLFLARRTDAFIRAAFSNANTPTTRAFSFGALSSYSANVYGSAYLRQVVGGPRRSHRFRDRLASNTIGAWFALVRPEVKVAATSLRRSGSAVTQNQRCPPISTTSSARSSTKRTT